MPLNEQIVTGRSFRKCIDVTNKLWQKISFWSKASDVEFDDGESAETKLGAIKGITTDLNITETGYAADMTALAQLNSEIDFKTLLVGQQVRPDKLNTLIDVDITDLYNKRMSGKKSIYEVPYISYIENPVQMCWCYYIESGRKIFRYAVTRESDLHSAINLNLAILYRDIS
ncbi:MAG: hypothetical protein HFI10_11955 [Lachnospiraceae bacterium]|nr:hypothetical protein [Lachnospiraceae bacterium]